VVNEAVAFYRVAVGLRPGNAAAHTNLGLALSAQGDLAGAIACYHKALALDPKYAHAHHNLGLALMAQGDLPGAIAAFQKAIHLDPKLAQAHNDLGNALLSKKDLAGAIAWYQQALAFAPKSAPAHNNLGNALYAQGDVKGAIVCYRKALELDPKFAHAHNNLGDALAGQGDMTGAIASFRKALALDPKDANAHGALGQALLAQGAFSEARAATQQALQLLPQGHPRRPHATRQLHECQRLLDLEARLTTILAGDDQPKDAAEQLDLADLCRRYKKRYTAAVRFYADAFTAKPKLSPAQQVFFRYNAACAAALAAAGKGEDASKLEGEEQRRLRQQALAWLRHNLQQHAKQLADADAKTRQAVQQTFQHWKKNADLNSVRGEEALAQLPEAERAAWQQFWAEVETLRQKAAAANSP
jgi:tetratricopeptide (TPR) repeat protein